jgi:hypothetical protein
MKISSDLGTTCANIAISLNQFFDSIPHRRPFIRLKRLEKFVSKVRD